jgi:hypothetical protein
MRRIDRDSIKGPSRKWRDLELFECRPIISDIVIFATRICKMRWLRPGAMRILNSKQGLGAPFGREAKTASGRAGSQAPQPAAAIMGNLLDYRHGADRRSMVHHVPLALHDVQSA